VPPAEDVTPIGVVSRRRVASGPAVTQQDHDAHRLAVDGCRQQALPRIPEFSETQSCGIPARTDDVLQVPGRTER
jgi:hypothetical protein